MPFSMFRSMESCWYFGMIFCALYSCCYVASCFSSLFHLCLISMDRYLGGTDLLVYPTEFTVSVAGLSIGVTMLLPRGLQYWFSTGMDDEKLEELNNTYQYWRLSSCHKYNLCFIIFILYLISITDNFIVKIF